MVNPETVVFNVGGTHFEVAMSTIQKYPDSMLARMVSEEWKDDGEDAKTPMFIDGNPERFSVILDIMRHGCAYLQWTKVSKEMVEKDAAYYGIDLEQDAVMEPTSMLRRAEILNRKREDCELELRIIELVSRCQTEWIAFRREKNLSEMALSYDRNAILHLQPEVIVEGYGLSKECQDLRDKYFAEAGMSISKGYSSYFKVKLK